MATYVLVHGAWHGGWCWRKLVPLLRRHNHDVYAPTLTGMGERGHLLSTHVRIETHVQDILQVLFYEDLRDVILVGHSYAGMIISAVAEEAGERIARLVYLDAFLPHDGDSIFSMEPSGEEYLRDQAETQGEGWLVPAFSLQDFGVTDADDVGWMQPRMTPVPIAIFAEPVHLPRGVAERLPRSYIFCTQFGFAAEAARAKEEGWDYHELPSGHDPMVTIPDTLATLLIGLAHTEG